MSEDLTVQGEIIFPRVHIARNEWRVYGKAPNLWPMLFKEAAQASIGIEMKQLIKVFSITQNRVTASSFVFRLYESCNDFRFLKN